MGRGNVPSRRIVVDADIVHGAGGEEGTHERGVLLRDCLNTIYVVCHRVVVDDELLGEWRHHRSRYARMWLTRMYAKKKVVKIEVDAADCRRRVEARVGRCDAKVVRDAKLIACAHETDRTVLSCDCKARRAVGRHCAGMPEVKGTVWVCPEHHEDVVKWLESGAPYRADWALEAT